MIVIPDLFGAYQKGKEQAIQSNWQDLKNYEAIEAARTANDRANLQLLGELADFDIQRQVAQHLGNASARADKLGEKQFVVDTNNVNSNIYTSGAKLGVIRGAAEDGRLSNYFDNQFNTSYYNSEANKDIAHNSATVARAHNEVLHDPSNLQLFRDTTGEVFVSGQKVLGINAKHAPDIAEATNQQTLSAAQAGTQTNKNALADAEGKAPYMKRIGAKSAQVTLEQLKLTSEQVDQSMKDLANLDAEKRKALEDKLLVSIAEIDAVLADPSREAEHPAMRARKAKFLRDLADTTDVSTLKADPSKSATQTGTTSTGTGDTSTPATNQSGSNSQQPANTTTPTVTATTLIPDTVVPTGTRAVVTNNVMGGNNYVQPVSNVQTFWDSQAGRFIDVNLVQPIQRAFTGYTNNGGGIVGAGVQQAIPRK